MAAEKKPSRSEASIAGRGLKDPAALTLAQIQSLAARVEADRRYGAPTAAAKGQHAALKKAVAEMKKTSTVAQKAVKTQPKPASKRQHK